jgi:UTP--glucose-1-phosphate uridylyltransferase
MSISKAVLPIAGLGTRFLPFTKVIPKEMLPIKGKPILQHLIEEAFDAGIREIVLVISKEKEEIIRSYLSPDTATTKKIAEKGKDKALDALNKLISEIKFHYVFQEEQLGDGHAILQAESILKNEPFAVLFGDDIIVTPDDEPSALKQMIKAHEKTSSSIIALEEVPKEKVSSYGIVSLKKDTEYELSGMVEKPDPDSAPSNLGIIGKYIVTPKIFENLRNAKKSVGNEIRLIDGFLSLIKTQKIYGFKTSGIRYDTGTLAGYKQAVLEIN